MLGDERLDLLRIFIIVLEVLEKVKVVGLVLVLHIILNHRDNVEKARTIGLMLLGNEVELVGWRQRFETICQFAEEGEEGELVLSL